MKVTSTRRLFSVCLALAACTTASTQTAFAGERTKMVGGAEMYPSKTIVDNAVNSKDHTTLVAAVKAAGLAETLSSAGPFTVFAPTDAAFAKLPAGTVDTLVKPENKNTLVSILTYHVVAGAYSGKDILKLIKAGDGAAQLKTVQGRLLTFGRHKGQIYIIDSKGGWSHISIADVNQSNGIIHVVDSVLMP